MLDQPRQKAAAGFWIFPAQWGPFQTCPNADGWPCSVEFTATLREDQRDCEGRQFGE